MINLLPPAARKEVTREYWTRVFVVWLWLVAGGFLVTGALLVPTYISVSVQQKILGTQFNQAQKKQGSFEDAEQQVKDINTLAQYLSQNPDTVAFSNLITILDDISKNSVTLDYFELKHNGTEVEAISLRGKARTRSLLAQFSTDVEANELFAEVKLPISNLAKDKDITFAMSVMLTKTD